MKINTVYELRFFDALTAPIDRLSLLPPWVKLTAILAALVQYIEHDAFGFALFILIASGVFDYYYGVKAARYLGKYDPMLAHAGAMGKLGGVLLLFLVRLIEHYIHVQGLLDTHGAAATAVAVSLIAMDIQSVAHHRESFGARPIPILSALLSRFQSVVSAKVSRSGGQP